MPTSIQTQKGILFVSSKESGPKESSSFIKLSIRILSNGFKCLGSHVPLKCGVLDIKGFRRLISDMVNNE